MIKELFAFVRLNRELVDNLFRRYQTLNMPLMLRTTLQDEFRSFCLEQKQDSILQSPLASSLDKAQEAAVSKEWLYIDIRPRVAYWKCIRYHFESKQLDIVDISEFLKFKELLVHGSQSSMPEIDFGPYERHFPMMHQTQSIGHGVEFLNRRLSGRLSHDLAKGDELILSFLRMHGYDNMSFMVNNTIGNMADLHKALQLGIELLAEYPPDTEWSEIEKYLKPMGFQPGWGRTNKKVISSFKMLANILEAPDYKSLERFLSRIPMIFNIVVLSPHGFFGQENVLGLPDTGGQVVYILDQVKALEKEMQRRLYDQGLDIKPQIIIITRLIPDCGDTTCNQAEEHVAETENVKIVRIPFRYQDGTVVPHWISRFKVWPYLERFAAETQEVVLARLGRRPDLVIGNYSDGNLVAYLLAQKMGVTQCNIAHALEKTKYLYSALYWKDMEEQYHFSCQFSADLIAMNAADFIITSTYQEIAGSPNVVGQYESYTSFTMPDLQRVIHGINVFDPKFNIVSPGADENVYFPFHNTSRRHLHLHKELDRLVFGESDEFSRGCFLTLEKPILFSMARLDKIKNLTGLAEWYGKNEKLREVANLLIIGGSVNPDMSGDSEEREQIELFHHIIDTYKLEGNLRWLGLRLEKNLTGELYRYLADRKGAFVQPAFFEAFGLTVIEAMASGLPTIATRFGGPLEIIENEKSGFHIDPNHGEQSAEIIADFFLRAKTDSGYWESFSKEAVKRVKSHYTWNLYARRLLTLTCIYGFWKYSTNLDRQETNRYLELLYHLQFRKLAEKVPVS